ncbi:MAG: insulinase family protein [Pseudomonadota bacterium]
MTTPPFELVDRHRIAALNVELTEYRHRKTGARHFHLASDDSNNAFMVGFLTVPQDSTGVAHILEHTSLCGSREFPVRDPFFMMIRRSLNTFMNAFTASDWTAYPFATQNAKDFDNLLRVYIDAVFYPRLDRLDFAQEGHRVEFEVEGDKSSDLVYKGVVFNEMKGAMSAPLSQVGQVLQSKLFPTITYHHNSGGDPGAIPDLTHEQLKAFHARHYHPSNAVFMTYGSFPVEEHQAKFEAWALKDFDRLSLDLDIPDETRFSAPQIATERYTLEGEDSTAERTHVLLGWLLDKTTDPVATMKSRILSGVLLDHSGSPLRRALETSPLGTSPSPFCGFDDSTREATFVCGLEGTETEHAAAVETLIVNVLEDVAKNGVPKEDVDSVLHQVELSQREVGGGGFPYGLQLMVRTLGTVLHGGRALDALELNAVIDTLREDAKRPEFIKGLAQSLLDNPHRVRLTMAPDTERGDAAREEEKSRLANMKSTMSDRELDALVTLANDLKARQEAEDNADLLPKVGLEDVPAELKIAEGAQHETALPTTWYEAGTNGLFYHQLIVDLPPLEREQLELLPLFCDCVTEVGCGNDDYLAVQARQAAVTGGVAARTSIRSALTDTNTVNGYVVLSSKALARNHESMITMLHRILLEARFDEHQRLRELIAQMRSHAEAQVTDQGHVLAIAAASSGLAPTAYLDHNWGGLVGLQKLRALDASISDESAMQTLAQTLGEIRDALAGSSVRALAVAESDHHVAIDTALQAAWSDQPHRTTGERPDLGFTPQVINEAWAVNSQVNFCAQAYRAVPEAHEDAPRLRVLAPFLRNGYLHRAIREQGGAYGGGANYSPDSGTFRFFSYRDPRLSGTLADFRGAVDWLQNESHQPEQLEEAILGVVSEIDRPDSPAGEAIGAYFASLHHRTPAHRRRFREQVLDVTLDDLRAVAERYLGAEAAHTAVVSGPQILDDECPESLRRITL